MANFLDSDYASVLRKLECISYFDDILNIVPLNWNVIHAPS